MMKKTNNFKKIEKYLSNKYLLDSKLMIEKKTIQYFILLRDEKKLIQYKKYIKQKNI